MAGCGRTGKLWARVARQARRWIVGLLAGCVASATLSGCAWPSGPTNSPSPGTRAIAWIRQDAHDIAQVWASVDDGPPRQITHRAGPPPACGYDIFGAPMFAPDLRHIAVAGGATCGDGQLRGQLFVVDAATGAIATVPLPGSGTLLTTQRSYGWVDARTLFALGDFDGDSGGVLYTLGAQTATPLPGLPSIIAEGVVRGATLFYVTADQPSGPIGTGKDQSKDQYTLYHTLLSRYDLSAHEPLPGAVDLGIFAMCACATGDFHLPGWDASPDGAHIAYQQVTPAVPTSALTGIASQTIFYANSDGSAPTQIVKALVTAARVRMRFSPDGTMIAITEAFNSPDVASGCVNTIGLYGVACMQFYGPDAYSYPAWHADSAYLIASAAPPALAPESSLYRYTPSRFHGVPFAANGYNPWSTP